MRSSKTNNSSYFSRFYRHITCKLSAALSSKLEFSPFIRLDLKIVYPTTNSEKNLRYVLIFLEIKSNPIAIYNSILLLSYPFMFFAIWFFINALDTIDTIVIDQNFDLFDPRHFFEAF